LGIVGSAENVGWRGGLGAAWTNEIPFINRKKLHVKNGVRGVNE